MKILLQEFGGDHEEDCQISQNVRIDINNELFLIFYFWLILQSSLKYLH
jgi:hypothetical protein